MPRREWTTGEIRRLREYALLKKTRMEAAILLGRPPNSVYVIVKRLKIDFGARYTPRVSKYTSEFWAEFFDLRAKNYSNHEIADTMGISRGALMDLLARKRKKDPGFAPNNQAYYENKRQATYKSIKFTKTMDDKLLQYAKEWRSKYLVEEFGSLILGPSTDAIARRMRRLSLVEGYTPTCRPRKLLPQWYYSRASPPAPPLHSSPLPTTT
jgi:predicted DNA-binding protein YlxM (UPF0122 family)